MNSHWRAVVSDLAALAVVSLCLAGGGTDAIAAKPQVNRHGKASIAAPPLPSSADSGRLRAEERWRQVLATDPENASALEALSRDLLEQRNYVSVIDLLQPVATAGKLTSAGAINLSVAYTKSGLVDQASDVLQTALRGDPGSVSLMEALSAVLVLRSRYQDAINILSSPAEQHSDDMQLQIRYLNLLAMARSPAAEPLCDRLLKVEPEQWELLYIKGQLRRQGGDSAAARSWLEKSVKRNPNYADSRFQLGLAEADLGETAAAKLQFQKAIALGFRDPQVHYELGRVDRALGYRAAAQQQFQLTHQGQLADLNQAQAATKSLEGERAEIAGNLAEAVSDYREALRLDPSAALLAYRLAMLLDRTGDLSGERAALEQAIKDNPQMAAAYNQLGYIDSVAGNTDAAIRNFRYSVEADPGYAKAWMNLAAALCLNSQWTAAREALRRTLELSPSDRSAQELLRRLNDTGPGRH
ncbi:MAG: tetratricopeptide repeat protein [Acidobacteriaceae bacterium]